MWTHLKGMQTSAKLLKIKNVVTSACLEHASYRCWPPCVSARQVTTRVRSASPATASPSRLAACRWTPSPTTAARLWSCCANSCTRSSARCRRRTRRARCLEVRTVWLSGDAGTTWDPGWCAFSSRVRMSRSLCGLSKACMRREINVVTFRYWTSIRCQTIDSTSRCHS